MGGASPQMGNEVDNEQQRNVDSAHVFLQKSYLVILSDLICGEKVGEKEAGERKGQTRPHVSGIARACVNWVGQQRTLSWFTVPNADGERCRGLFILVILLKGTGSPALGPSVPLSLPPAQSRHRWVRPGHERPEGIFTRPRVPVLHCEFYLKLRAACVGLSPSG